MIVSANCSSTEIAAEAEKENCLETHCEIHAAKIVSFKLVNFNDC